MFCILALGFKHNEEEYESGRRVFIDREELLCHANTHQLSHSNVHVFGNVFVRASDAETLLTGLVEDAEPFARIHPSKADVSSVTAEHGGCAAGIDAGGSNAGDLEEEVERIHRVRNLWSSSKQRDDDKHDGEEEEEDGDERGDGRGNGSSAKLKMKHFRLEEHRFFGGDTDCCAE
ncbi:uncharacterized protein MONOS_6402 [Monocercomonoides exilis]|uniref:uncharacterized protein n=1 Tax=Monocercomonoides exilis TaxID=2049356 RepID=UPI00355A100A|nr:hypothetical protein MONOS_6402 [Monocercomonoides exilis]|eukprot:MONOS_6402.1-p1 / transcript=MONOS_6402.1 / gene=MONOS_6402 / organism=Monocercomonoides_exilis_PA203 / gene_product=unspecified product / transcript_product=unspecified product / location=Mono_scaffold00201:46586-47333(-) / protein_length=176 / sequence_SO=supercontig / SO=protein_coding / is_pseudo=false